MTHLTTARIRLRTRDMTHIALFAVLMAVCAWISIPITTISFTLQTFAVFAALLTLGGRLGTYAVVVYLLLGAVGLPVFSGFRGGPAALLGASGGYILGFLASALVYWLLTARGRDSLPLRILACVAVSYTHLDVYKRQVFSINSSSVQPSRSAPVRITSREQPAANFLSLNFFFRELTSMS